MAHESVYADSKEEGLFVSENITFNYVKIKTLKNLHVKITLNLRR